MSARNKKISTLSDIGEFGLINRIRKRTNSSSSVLKGIGDDCAVVLLVNGVV